MIRLKSAILAALILVLAFAPLPAQKPGDEARWAALNKEMNAAYEKKDWTTALSVLDRMIQLGDETKNQVVSGRGPLYESLRPRAGRPESESPGDDPPGPRRRLHRLFQI